MGIFKIFTNSNPDFLKDDEVDAANLLQNICKSYANGDPNYIPNGLVKLSFGIYTMSFNRTNYDIIPLEVLNNKDFLSKRPGLLTYLDLLDKIKLFLKKVVADEKIIANHKNNELYRNLMLKILKSIAADIDELKKEK